MERNVLKKLTPTAQVKELMLECLADGKEHTRKEIMEYVKQAAEEMGIQPYSSGCISGGIFQATRMEQCEKIASATYRLVSTSFLEGDLKQAIYDSIGDFKEKLISLIRSVDIVYSTDTEMNQIKKVREYMKVLEGWQEEFR